MTAWSMPSVISAHLSDMNNTAEVDTKASEPDFANDEAPVCPSATVRLEWFGKGRHPSP